MSRLFGSTYLRKVVGSSGLLVVFLGVVALVGGFGTTGSVLRLVVNFFITVVIIVGLQSFTGNSGIPSYGHAAFVGVGAYVTAWLTVPSVIKTDIFRALPRWLLDAQWGFLPTLLAAALAGAAVAAVLGLVICRMRETAIAMSTLGLLVIAHGIYDNWLGWTRGTVGVYALPVHTTIWTAFAVCSVAVVVAVMFKYSRVGMRLQAAREDPLAAEASGVDVVRARYVSWVFSAGLSALAGSLWAQFNLAFGPSQFYYSQVFAALAMLVIGGMATVSGAVVGAGVVTVLSELLRRVEEGNFFGIQMPQISGLAQMILAIITLLILIFRRDGLLAWWEVDDWVLKARLRFARGGGAASGTASTPGKKGGA